MSRQGMGARSGISAGKGGDHPLALDRAFAGAVRHFAFDGHGIHIVLRDGQPWFVLADICRVLEVGNPSQASSRLDDDEKGIISNDTPYGEQQMLVVNESGLYSLILTSRKEAAKRFRRWVTGEVLPSIRRSGAYLVDTPARGDPEDAVVLRALAILQRRIAQQDSVLAFTAPKAEALDRLSEAEGSMTLRDAGKALRMGQKEFCDLLLRHQWVYRGDGSRAPGPLRAYQRVIERGWMEQRLHCVARRNGTSKLVPQPLVTAQGLAKLAGLMTGLPARHAGGGHYG